MNSDDRESNFEEICTGHYVRGVGYGCVRSRGTTAWQLIYTVAGTGRFSTLSGDLLATAGDAVLIPPGVRHDYGTGSEGHWELLWALFRPPKRWTILLKWADFGGDHFRLRFESPLRESISERLAAMHRLALQPAPRAAELAVNALEAVFLLADSANPLANLPRKIDPAVAQVLEYVSQNLGRPLMLQELAEISGQSISRLCHAFKRDLKVSPQAYVEEQRITRAAQLVHRTTMSVKEIAKDLGYSSPFYFARRFKRRMGISPSAYRTRMKASAAASTIARQDWARATLRDAF